MNKNLLITSLRKLALSAVLAFTVIGLRAQSVYDFIAASPDHTSLTAAIDAAGLAATLSGPGEFTVFAPTDAAFDAALVELGVTLGDLAADVPALTDILLYHVVDGTVLSSELMNGMTPTPLNAANTIKVTVGGSGVFVNQAQVTSPDNTLFEGDAITNGVVHVTDGVILATETVVDVALSTGVHTSLVAAVIAAELLPALTNPFAELTVFAPTDDAFTAALTELGVTLGDLAADIPALQAILTYHVVDGTVLSSDLTNGMTPTPLNAANTIKVTVGGSGVFVNQAQVTGPDNSTGNGVVHVTDGVILATETVVDVALSTGVHTSLVAAVIAAELLPALTNPFAELTVFAPTDDAFTAALTELGVTLGDLAADIPALQAILTYHVVDGTVLSSDLTNGMTPTPLNAANTIKVTVGGSGVFVNQAQVTGPDNSTGNGVVHVTDGVILATETVVDVALSTGVHTSLVAAVIAAELLPALTNPFAELTVFAPTDDAFTAALTELGVTLGDLAADIPALQAILTYHVVDGTVLSSDLTNGAVPTLSGEEVIVNIDMGAMINSSNVTGADNETGNGVVHVIDAVLFATYLGVEENDLGDYSLTVYPNPSSHFVTVDTNGTDFNSVIIQDYTGRVVFEQTVSADTTILDVHEFASGQYIITLIGNNNKVSEKLLISSNR